MRDDGDLSGWLRVELQAAFDARAVLAAVSMLAACVAAGWTSLHWAAVGLERVGPVWLLPVAGGLGAVVVRGVEALTTRCFPRTPSAIRDGRREPA